MAELDPIPGPPGLPFVGNARDVDPNNFSLSIQRLADIYGTLPTPNSNLILVHSLSSYQVRYSGSISAASTLSTSAVLN